MYAKLENGEDFYDHEVLEILLYSVIPRANTNPLAHKLLDKFCSISELLKADVKEIKSVEGAGEAVARFLRTVGLCAERAGNIEGAAVLKTFGDSKRFAGMRLRGKIEEFLELYFLEKSGRLKRIFTYTAADRNKVVANAQEIIKNIALAKPYGILAAHNHLNGSVEPSESDDVFTGELQLLCTLNNVKLWDHLIYSDGNFYSYRDENKLAEMAEKYSLGRVVEWIKDSSST